MFCDFTFLYKFAKELVRGLHLSNSLVSTPTVKAKTDFSIEFNHLELDQIYVKFLASRAGASATESCFEALTRTVVQVVSYLPGVRP